MFSVTLPMPHRALWANSREHWAVKARETKRHRRWAANAAYEQGAPHAEGLPLGDCLATVEFQFATKRRRDMTNIGHCLKAYYDGFEDAGVYPNDERIKGVNLLPLKVVKGETERVTITLTPIEGNP
jgi:Holliday junction resolvase RusA-like endonuclease